MKASTKGPRKGNEDTPKIKGKQTGEEKDDHFDVCECERVTYDVEKYALCFQLK